MFPRVSIIILNWNGWKDTIECLESLYRITYPNYDVIVVDNGSRDDSVQRIKEYCEGKIEVNSKFFKYDPSNKPIKVFEISEDEARKGRFNRPLYEKFDPDRRLILIKNKNNYGFTGGNNIGMKFALNVLNPKYVLLLNNDTVVDRKFLDELVKVAESDEKIGIVGSKIYYYEYNGRTDVIWALGGDEINIMNVRVGKFITGCCMLIKKEVLNKLNGFDEKYFCYWEDVDLSVRCKKLGYKLAWSPTSILWHKVGASSGRNSPITLYYFSRNFLYFVKKHTNLFNFIITLILYLSYITILKAPFYFLKKKKISLLKYQYFGVLDSIIGNYYKKNI